MTNYKRVIILLVLTVFANNTTAQTEKKHSGEIKKEVNSEIKSMDIKSIDKNKDGKVFQCPMDWEIIKDKSGKCEICKMNLKEYDVKTAEENLNKYLKVKQKSESHNHSTIMHSNNSKSAEVWNYVCPLDGEKVNKKGATSNYKGKTIAFCCEDCKVEFDKQPEKYMQNLSKDGKKFIVKK